SARTVSRVIRITLGRPAPEPPRARAKKRSRPATRRIKEKGVCIVADSFFETKAQRGGSENELHADLHRPRAALGEERVARRDVRSLSNGRERTCIRARRHEVGDFAPGD